MSHIIAELPNFLPTRAQRRWLVDLLCGRKPESLCQGKYEWFGGTKNGLIRRGLIDEQMKLTKVGRKLAKAIRAENP